MQQYKLATSFDISDYIDSQRNLVNIFATDFTDVAAIIISLEDIQQGALDTIKQHSFGQPIFALIHRNQVIPADTLSCLAGVIDLNKDNSQLYAKQLETAAQKYEQNLLSPFFGQLKKYVEQGYSAFDCPGHQGGAFFRRHPLGNLFVDYFVKIYSVQISVMRTFQWAIS